jgi:hypothetical protein
LKEYVEAWQQEHSELAEHYWAIEDIISKANFVHEQIVALIAALKRFSANDQAPEFCVRSFYLLREWLDISVRVEDRAKGPEATYGHVQGLESLRRNLSQAQHEDCSARPAAMDSDGRVFEMNGELRNPARIGL